MILSSPCDARPLPNREPTALSATLTASFWRKLPLIPRSQSGKSGSRPKNTNPHTKEQLFRLLTHWHTISRILRFGGVSLFPRCADTVSASPCEVPGGIGRRSFPAPRLSFFLHEILHEMWSMIPTCSCTKLLHGRFARLHHVSPGIRPYVARQSPPSRR